MEMMSASRMVERCPILHFLDDLVCTMALNCTHNLYRAAAGTWDQGGPAVFVLQGEIYAGLEKYEEKPFVACFPFRTMRGGLQFVVALRDSTNYQRQVRGYLLSFR